MSARGLFSPIETVVAEAEARVESEWKREHEPCKHDRGINIRMASIHAFCIECGAEVPRD